MGIWSISWIPLEQVCALVGVALHGLPLLGGQRARLVEDVFGDAHFADVVQQGGTVRATAAPRRSPSVEPSDSDRMQTLMRVVERVVVVALDCCQAQYGGGVLEQLVEQRLDDVLQRADFERLAELGLGLDVAHRRDARVVALAWPGLDLRLRLRRPSRQARWSRPPGTARDSRALEEAARGLDVGDAPSSSSPTRASTSSGAQRLGEGERRDPAREQVLDQLAYVTLSSGSTWSSTNSVRLYTLTVTVGSRTPLGRPSPPTGSLSELCDERVVVG